METQNLFHFIECFRKLHNITDSLSIWMLEDPIEKIKSYICGAFQLFFSKIHLVLQMSNT